MDTLLRCLALASFLGLALCYAPEWTPCKVDGKDPLFKPTSLDLTPDRIVRGSSMVFKILGKNEDHVVTDGKIEVHVLKEYDIVLPFYEKHGTFELYSESKGLCKRAKCPIEVGDVEFTYNKNIPSITPAGQYVIKLVATEKGNDNLLMCFTLKIDIHAPKDPELAQKTGVAIS